MLKRNKECIAMLLAGGQGSRLKVLTEEIAKPAVPFGGKYRIIDFPLSNCVNSGIDTVGILTQYRPLVLNSYIGNGQPWGLNRNYGGVHILPPYSQGGSKDEWYKGTANAIYQNLHFIDMYDPEYVLILSGDHIYKMDYSKMLQFHKDKGADCTIAVIDVPVKEASRFGIMNARGDGSIYEFEEKPPQPKSTNASMGIYIFSKAVLSKYLIEDEANPNSVNDFGKNIIPSMLNDDMKLFAYPFEGYWKDVGTIESLWESNMDLLDQNGTLKLDDNSFKIYARNYAMPSSFVSNSGQAVNSMIGEGCIIKGHVENSIISTGCVIREGANITNSVIMAETVVEKDTVITYSVIGEEVHVCQGVTIGEKPEECDAARWGICAVGHGKTVESGTVLKAKETL